MISQVSAKYQFCTIHTADARAPGRTVLRTTSRYARAPGTVGAARMQARVTKTKNEFHFRYCLVQKGPFKCYVTLFFWKLDPHPPRRNVNNVEHYTFVTLFSRKSDTPPHTHLRYVTLEWPQNGNGALRK